MYYNPQECPTSMFSPTYALYALLHEVCHSPPRAVDMLNKIIDNFLCAIQVPPLLKQSSISVLTVAQFLGSSPLPPVL